MDSTVREILQKNSVKPPKKDHVRLASVGQRMRELRIDKKLTQSELAKRIGISHSSLSKIENSQLSPTFETILRIVDGLEIDISDLLAASEDTPLRTRRVITRAGHGEKHVTKNYVYETLCNEITNKRMIPLVVRIKANSLEQFGTLMRHPGEEVIYVLKGEIELNTEHYAPVQLESGDCAYYDSSMGHACISTGKKEALVFWVSTPT